VNQTGLGIAAGDIAAPPDLVYEQFSNLNRYVGKVPCLTKVHVYKKRKLGATTVTKAEYNVRPLPGYGYTYYVEHRANPNSRMVVFYLDHNRKSAFEEMQGKWYVQAHPTKEGWSRVYYQCALKLPVYIPKFVKTFATQHGLSSAVGWVKKESEKAAGNLPNKDDKDELFMTTLRPLVVKDRPPSDFAALSWLPFGSKKGSSKSPLESSNESSSSVNVAGEATADSLSADVAPTEDATKKRAFARFRWFRIGGKKDSSSAPQAQLDDEVEDMEPFDTELVDQVLAELEKEDEPTPELRWDGGWFTPVRRPDPVVSEPAAGDSVAPEDKPSPSSDAPSSAAGLLLVARAGWFGGALLVASGISVAGFAACHTTGLLAQPAMARRPPLPELGASTSGVLNGEAAGMELRASLPDEPS